jgi:hypothetical protein
MATAPGRHPRARMGRSSDERTCDGRRGHRARQGRFTLLFVLAAGATAAMACGTSSSTGPGDGGNATDMDGSATRGDVSVMSDGNFGIEAETGSVGKETGTSQRDAGNANDVRGESDAESVADGDAGIATGIDGESGTCVLSDGGVGMCGVWRCCTYENLLGSHVECIAPSAFDGGCPPPPP